MVLLAMSELTSWIGTAGFFGCLALIVHAVLPPLTRARETTKPKPWRLYLAAAIEFVSISLWLGLTLPILAWLQWGDRGFELAELAWGFAAAIAAATAGVTFWRCWKGIASRRFLQIHFWIPVILLSLLGTVYSYEFVRQIDGMTAESAANNYTRRSAHLMEEPIRLVEYQRERPPGSDPNRCKSYRIIDATGPRGRVTVCRKGFWWTHASSLLYGPSEPALNEAKDLIKEGNHRKAKSKLERIIEYYPGTSAEAEGKKLLEQLDGRNGAGSLCK